MNTQQFAARVIGYARRKALGLPVALKALPVDQLDAIFGSPRNGPISPDGWTLPDDPELYELFERCEVMNGR